MLQDFGNKKQKRKKNLSSGDLMVSVDEEKQSQQEDEEEVLVSNVTSFVWSLGQNKHELSLDQPHLMFWIIGRLRALPSGGNINCTQLAPRLLLSWKWWVAIDFGSQKMNPFEWLFILVNWWKCTLSNPPVYNNMILKPMTGIILTDLSLWE